MTPIKPIDEQLFVKMWDAGETSAAIGRAVGLSKGHVPVRAARIGLDPRPSRLDRARDFVPVPRGKIRLERSKPVADPKPVAGPTYHPGLSDAIKRAKGSVQRLGKVATSYRVAYREVLAMAGVTV